MHDLDQIRLCGTPASQNSVQAFVEVTVPIVLFVEDLEAEGFTLLLLEDLRVRGWGRKIASIGEFIPVSLDVEIEDIEVDVISGPGSPGVL